jgi:hypothetical protein
MNNKAAKAVFEIALAGVLIYALFSHSQFLKANISERDSIAYWTAGDLLLHRQNPYDAATVLTLEAKLGYKENRPLVLRTPPWSLFMVIPLGMVNAFWAWILWIAFSVGSLLVSMRLCWKVYGRDGIPQNTFLVIGYTFAPLPACLVAGQMGLMLLLGIVLFLWLEPKRPYFAGAALIFPFAKPHLLTLFWLAFVAWMFLRKKFAVAAGFTSALLVATAIPLAFDPKIFDDYLQMLRQASIGHEFIPALSGVVRLLFFRRFFWVQFIPMACGVLWCLRFCARNWSHWDWRRQGLALMVISVLTTPYSWLTDEVVLLPAILLAAVHVFSTQEKTTFATRAALTVFAALNGLLLLILSAKVPFSTGIYFWSSLLWFAWYVFGQRRCRRSGSLQSESTFEDSPAPLRAG